MVSFGLRFDFRNPAFANTSMADRYAAALDMAEWADRLGCTSISVSEHHGSPDGYIPSPLVMLGGMASRTVNTRFVIAALIVPFHDPLRIAEDLIVLDHMSKGRVDVIAAGGYVHEEFALFGVPMKERPRRVTEAVETLKAAFGGEPFAYRGRTVRITPAPYRPGGPAVLMGGSSEAAARRAARIADGFVPSTPAVWEFYRSEMQQLGKGDPGPCPFPPTKVTVLAHDVEQAWAEHAPYFLHETNSYGTWKAQDDVDSPYRTFDEIASLRQSDLYEVLTPAQLVEQLRASEQPHANFHPLCGGVPPGLAWKTLNLFENEVLPALR